MSFRSLRVGANGANASRTVFQLPDETFLEILSYFPVVSFRYKFSGPRSVWGQTFLPVIYAERLNALRAVTQTCRTLRRKFLSWLWERVEACVAPERAAWYISLGNALESKCHILLKNPPLATHVRSEIINLLILLCLIPFRSQRYGCYRHALPDGHNSPRLCKLSPVIAKPPYIGAMPRSPGDDDKAQEGF